MQDQCGPFTDVSPGLCPYVLEMYYLGITAGTSATTFSPDSPMTRGQAAVFVSKAINQTLARSSRRAALGQWWTTTPHWDLGLGVTAVGGGPFAAACDGSDVWTTVTNDGLVARVRASDGKLLETWTGATNATAILSAMGRIFLTRNYPPEALYMIDPSQPAGSPTAVTADLGGPSFGLAFDGSRIWATSFKAAVLIITPGSSIPWSVTTVTTGFMAPIGIVWDGSNIWVGDQLASSLFKLDAGGSILQTVALPAEPGSPAFDGANIWVPVGGAPAPSSVVVVRVSDGTILANLPMGNNGGVGGAAFDGERVLTTDPPSQRIYLWRAADFAPLGNFATEASAFPLSVASNGVNFWVTLNGNGELGRF